jgi:hypothetical protein
VVSYLLDRHLVDEDPLQQLSFLLSRYPAILCLSLHLESIFHSNGINILLLAGLHKTNPSGFCYSCTGGCCGTLNLNFKEVLIPVGGLAHQGAQQTSRESIMMKHLTGRKR